MRQFRIDVDVFIDSLSKLTGISKAFLKSYNKTNTFSSLFSDEPPPGLNETQKHKLKLLVQFKILYDIEKNARCRFCVELINQGR